MLSLFRHLTGLVLFAFLTLPVQAAPAAAGSASLNPPVEGKDYRLLRPAQPGDSPGKIEVIEFFSYACPHCADFNTELNTWASRLPTGVVFKKVPVLFNRTSWSNLARMYYSFEAMGNLSSLDQSIFSAMHQNGENLANPSVLNDWLIKKKVDVQKFNELFNSFGIRSKVNRAEQLSRDYAIDGVPALVINGQYIINNELPHDRQLKVADALLESLRTKKKP